METKPIFTFLDDVVRCEYKPDAGEMFAYNGVTIYQARETYLARLNRSFNDFRECAFQLSLENCKSLDFVLSQFRNAQNETFYDVPDEGYLAALRRDARNNDNPSLRQTIAEAQFLNEMVGLQKWFLQQAIELLEGLTGKHAKRPIAQDTASSIKPVEATALHKKLDEYDELLSVKDLTDIFHCDRRTISNWESEGLLHNLAETSQERNCSGRRKRGKEKRFSKEAVLRQIKLHEKYNATMARYSFSA